MRAKIAGVLLAVLATSSAVGAPATVDGFGSYMRSRSVAQGLSAIDVVPIIQGNTTSTLSVGALSAYLQANLPIITMLGFTPLATNGNGSQLVGITPAQIGAQPLLGFTPLAATGSGAQLTGITAAQVGALAGTKSGNTAIFATVTGTLTNGHCVSLDGLGNLVDAGAACGSGSGGSGSVASAQQNQVAYYPSASAAVAGLNLAGLTIANGALGVVYGTAANTAAQGNDGRIVGALQNNYNLADLTNATTARANLGAATSGANNDITSLAGLTTALSTGQGGTGKTSFAAGTDYLAPMGSGASLTGITAAQVGAAARGSNTDITSLGGLTTALSTAQGGTGKTTFAPGADYVAPNGALGTPSSATLTNATGLPLATGVTGLLAISNGGTGASTTSGLLANIGGLAKAGDTASGTLGSAAGGSCDTSQWTGYIGGTQSPQPSCYASKMALGITIPFPAVVGIGAADGSKVTVGDTTFDQYAQHLLQATTTMDNNHQEDALTINMISRTGGGGLAQTNHNQKVALYIPVLAVPGASNTWAINDDLEVLSGVGNYSFYRHEGDMTNFNGDYKPGGCPHNSDGSANCPSGQIDGNAFGDFMTFTGYPITAAMDFTGNPNSGSANLHYGLLFQGGTGTTVGQGLIDTATINDSTNSPVIIKAYSTHTAVIDTLNATVSRIWQSVPGQLGCFNGGDDCLGDITAGVMRFTSRGGATLQLASSTNAYNGLQVTAAAKTFGPTLNPFSLDSETNLPLNLRGLGTGAVTLGNANGQSVAALDPGASPVNYVGIQGTPSGFGPAIKALGSDSNVPLNLYAQGSGSIFARGQFQTTAETDLGVGSANFTQIIGASAGFGPIISAVGSDTNVPLNLRGKGASPVVVLGGLSIGGGMSAANLVTAAGSAKGTLCVDTTGVVYVKTTTGACL